MSHTLLKHWGLYLSLCIIFCPLVLIGLVDPDWLARLIGLSFLYISPPLVCLYAVLSSNNPVVYEGAWLYKRFSKNKVDYLTRIIAVFVGAFSFIHMSYPFTQDVIAVIRGQAPLSHVAVVENASNSGRALVSESIVLAHYPNNEGKNTFTAWYFSPRYIMQDNTYEFLYLPHTRIILDATIRGERTTN